MDAYARQGERAVAGTLMAVGGTTRAGAAPPGPSKSSDRRADQQARAAGPGQKAKAKQPAPPRSADGPAPKARETRAEPAAQREKTKPAKQRRGFLDKVAKLASDPVGAAVAGVRELKDVGVRAATAGVDGARAGGRAIRQAAKATGRFVDRNSGKIGTIVGTAGIVLSFTPLAPVGVAMMGASMALAAHDTAKTYGAWRRGEVGFGQVALAGAGMIPGGSMSAVKLASGVGKGVAAARLGSEVVGYASGAAATGHMLKEWKRTGKPPSGWDALRTLNLVGGAAAARRASSGARKAAKPAAADAPAAGVAAAPSAVAGARAAAPPPPRRPAAAALDMGAVGTRRGSQRYRQYLPEQVTRREQALWGELQARHPDPRRVAADVLWVDRLADGSVVYMDRGGAVPVRPDGTRGRKAGAAHIIHDHWRGRNRAGEFDRWFGGGRRPGESANEFSARTSAGRAKLPNLVRQALTNGEVVGIQGDGRPIYRFTDLAGTQRHMAVSVSSNGRFVIGANPKASQGPSRKEIDRLHARSAEGADRPRGEAASGALVAGQAGGTTPGRLSRTAYRELEAARASGSAGGPRPGHALRQLRPLTESESRALDWQTGIAYRDINRDIRSSVVDADPSNRYRASRQHLSELDGAFEASAFERPARLYRGVRMQETDFQRMLSQGRHGDTAYMSTSRDPIVAYSFATRGLDASTLEPATGRPVIFEIEAQPGQRGLDASRLSGENEAEMLLPRGSEIRDIRVRIDDDGVAIVQGRLWQDPVRSADVPTTDAARRP